MNIYDEFITPAELTGYARAALADRAENRFQLTRWLPHRQVNDLVYRFARGGGGLAEAATFRAYDAEPGFGRREGISRVTGELPPIGQQYVLGEYDSLRLRGGGAGQEIRDLLLRDSERISRHIDTRMEFARADALVNGSVTLAENGVYATVDFDRSPAHTVAPAVLWTDLDNSTPLDDMQSWRDVYAETTGASPGTVLTSTRARNLLCRNAQVRGQVFPLATTPPRVTVSDLNSMLTDFDLPSITVWDARAIDTAGVTRRFIPDDRLLFLPGEGEAEDMGGTLWGTTAEAMEPQYGIGEADHPGMVVGAFKQAQTPVRVLTIGAAIGLPILAEPNLSMVADVA